VEDRVSNQQGNPSHSADRAATYGAEDLLASARLDAAGALALLGSSREGLSEGEARDRLARFGPNDIQLERKRPLSLRLLDNLRNPLVILLTLLGLISYLTGDIRATVMIALMVVLGVVLRFVQEMRSDRAAEKLKGLVMTKATVVRDGQQTEIAVTGLVTGDIVLMSAGDMIPADIRLISAHDLYLNESTLTGESLPVGKGASVATDQQADPLELPMLCFQGSNVQTGSGSGVVVLTGGRTYFAELARGISAERAPTNFDQGINRFTWLMIRLMMILVPLVFLLNGLSRGDWLEAFLFALAVAVGLTPEMLPMIVTVNLSKGAIAMSHKKVIVKRLNAIQNLGAMDLLCTDKTGTLTQGRIVLIRHVDVEGNEREEILHYAYLNSYFETGLKNVMDVAVLEHEHLEGEVIRQEGYLKVDEIPFDFERRRLSVVVDDKRGERTLICKGAVEEVMAHCSHIMVAGNVLPLDSAHHFPLSDRLVEQYSEQGFRVIALAFRTMPPEARAYTVADEAELTLMGFLAFLDPPKETAAAALRELHQSNIIVKILTGDNGVVTRTICQQVGLPVEGILLGSSIEQMSDDQLAAAVEPVTIFAKLSPSDKVRVIQALQARGHVVGFMGDGINDAPALKGSDVGISVDTAVDIARESSDIILLKQSLRVLHEGVVEGRKVFGNILKYIRMAASSNFGNMFSIVGASLFLPFLPMLPIQILTNNLLYDFSQTMIPTDDVDREWLKKPRRWDIGQIRRFIVTIGPISSIFDYATFFVMLYIFDCWNNPALFHTGWFVESLFTQTLIIHVIRTNRVPFIESRASAPLLIASLLVVCVGAWLPYSPVAPALGLEALPRFYWVLLGGMMLAYILLTQIVKSWLARRFEPEGSIAGG
jgi:Mg2+-importing ATPase